MAAPTLSEKDARKTLRAKLKTHKPKAHLISPYSYAWPVLDESVTKEVIEKISKLFESLPLKGQKRPSKAKQKTEDTKTEETEDERKRKHLRSQMAIGINAVTRGLEKDDLDLVLVCRSTQPQLITKHLIPLTSCRHCPAMCIPQFSTAVAPLMGMKSLISIGFKKSASKEDSEFCEFVKYGQMCAIPITMPWNDDTENTEPLIVPKESLPTESETSVQMEEDQETTENSKDLKTEKSESSVQSKGKLWPFVKKENQESEKKNDEEDKNIQTDNIKTETQKAEDLETNQENTEKDLEIIPVKQNVTSSSSVVKKFVPKDDYSYLYVFKSEKTKTKGWGDFIALGDSSSDEETFCYKYTPPQETDLSQNLTSLKRKHSKNQNAKSDISSDIPKIKYKKTKIGHQFKNPNKTKKKKKLKK